MPSVTYPSQINGFYNDIALFKLSRPAELNEYVVPACLPVEYEGKPLDSLVGRTPSVIGWGTTFYGTLSGGAPPSTVRHPMGTTFYGTLSSEVTPSMARYPVIRWDTAFYGMLSDRAPPSTVRYQMRRHLRWYIRYPMGRHLVW